MVSKELRKLNRRELIEIIYQMKKNEQQMQAQIAALQAELEEKRLRLSRTGSIAEAALAVTNVFSAAQEAANLYLQEIACMKKEAEKECAKILEEARNTASNISLDDKNHTGAVHGPIRTEQSKLRKLSRMLRRWRR
jgi:cell division septum initiation protein DivIVA